MKVKTAREKRPRIEMIDTIKIAHSYLKMPDFEDLHLREWRKDFKNTGEFKSWIYKEKGEFPYLSFFIAPDAKVYLSARVSLPAFLFGSNLLLPNQEEIKQGLIKLSEYVTEKSGLEFDAQTAIVWEAHFTKDFFVGDNSIRQVISKLSAMNIPRFDRGRYRETTLYFHSKGKGKEENKPRTICIYDKHEERLNKSNSATHIQESKGILRLEFRYKTANAVKRLVKGHSLSNREAQTIFTEKISSAVLSPIERQILTLLENTNELDLVVLLNKQFSQRRIPKLIQFLYYFDKYGANFYKIESLRFPMKAYSECRKDLREIGVYSLSDAPKPIIEVRDVS